MYLAYPADTIAALRQLSSPFSSLRDSDETGVLNLTLYGPAFRGHVLMPNTE